MWCGTYLNGPSTSGPPLNNKYSNTFVVLYANSYNTTYHKRLGIIIALIYGLIKKSLNIIVFLLEITLV